MKKITGLIASKGLAVGKVFPILDKKSLDIPTYSIKNEDVPKEKERLELSLNQTIEEVQKILNEKNTTLSKDEYNLLSGQLAILGDVEFIKDLYADLEKEYLNIETLLQKKIDAYVAILSSSDNDYMRERALDIKTAFDGVFDKLLSPKRSENRFANVPKESIIIVSNIKTSEVLALKDANPKGIVMEEGGITGHISIIARSWEIPMLVSASNCTEYAISGLDAILDAEKGFVCFNPSTSEITLYQNKITEEKKIRLKADARQVSGIKGIVKSLDGVEVSISANIAFKDEAFLPSMDVVDGIGLFRTEFLFLQDNIIPSEELQAEIYSSIAKTMGARPTIIRTFDAGSDKMLQEQETLHEKNPLLGWRAIRYCFARPDMFRAQLRAILRSSAWGNVHILIPMVSSIEEVKLVRLMLEEEKHNLEARGIGFNKNIPLGIMIEVPSTAVTANLFAKYVDFMSIGTNDLVQYIMAADRENGKVATLANYFEPAVLKLLAFTISTTYKIKKEGYFVSMCGEMASNFDAMFLLLGMGLRHFSMPSWKIYEAKKFVSSINISDAQKMYHHIARLDNRFDVSNFISENCKKYCPPLF